MKKECLLAKTKRNEEGCGMPLCAALRVATARRARTRMPTEMYAPEQDLDPIILYSAAGNARANFKVSQLNSWLTSTAGELKLQCFRTFTTYLRGYDKLIN